MNLASQMTLPLRFISSKYIKCTASDMLSLIPVLAMWCQSVLVPLALCTPAVNAFIALCNIVQCLWCAGRSTLQPDTLDALVEDFLAKFSGVWGFAWMTPKFHWMLHFGDHLRKLGFLANCFCLERRHRIAKRYANDLKNISRATSDSLLMEVACHHVSSLEDDGSCNFAIGLRNKKVANKKTKQQINRILEVDADTVVYVSLMARFSLHGLVHRDDIVLIRESGNYKAAKVLMLLEVHDIPIAMLEEFSLKSADGLTRGFTKWSTKNTVQVLTPLDDILETCTHTILRSAKGVMTILHPPDFR